MAKQVKKKKYNRIQPLRKTQGVKGRPELFDEELAGEFLIRVTNRSLQAVCRDDDDMPSDCTVYRWLLKDGKEYDAFREAYNAARFIRSYEIGDKIVDVVEELLKPPSKVKSGQEKPHRLEPEVARVAIYGYDKASACMKPNKKIELTGAKGSALYPDTTRSYKAIVGGITSIAERIRKEINTEGD